MYFGIWNVLEVSFTSLWSKEDVILPPEDKGLWLVLAEELLPPWIECNISAVVIEQIHLHSPGVWPLHEPIIHIPVVGADLLWIFVTMEIDLLDYVKLQEPVQRLFCLRSPILPQRVSQTVPCTGKPNFVCICVLYNQPFKPVWMKTDNSESYRSAIVLHVQPKVCEAYFLQKALDDFGEPIKCIVKLIGAMHVRVTEARVVWGNDMKAV